ncbi:class I SAM-dependent methyltransferase [Streptomyces sp. BI20]|uniref:class I SAM-dependent methyltransferase n=1 Tax=Streptomyces sp. BI20 TaxID=3403460 RepID=UPI003C7238B1
MTTTPDARTPAHEAHDHGHGHDAEAHAAAEAARPAGNGAAYWDARYGENERFWSGEPNAVLVREITGLTPGTALDLGCGEGADAVWLARAGWRVTGLDVSAVALERAARHAEETGTADRTRWLAHDLTTGFPAGEWDLISACFLHNRGEFPREEILRAAARAVAPGGTLLIAGHAGWAPWTPDPDHTVLFPTPEEVVASLELPEGAWEVVTATETDREQLTPEGEHAHRTDNVVRVRRLPA